MNPRARSTGWALAAGAGVYALGVLLGCLADGAYSQPAPREAKPTASAPATVARVQAQSAGSNVFLPAISSNAPAPVDNLFSALGKAESQFHAGFFDLHDELCGALSKLAATDLARLWQAFKDSKSTEVREFVRYDVIAAWAKLDAGSALAAAQTLTQASERESTVSTVLGIWARKDLDAAVQRARQIKGEAERDWALAIIVRYLADTDAPKAATLLDQIPTTPARDRAASLVVGALADQNPAAAMAVADQIRSVSDRSVAFSDIADALMAADPGRALERAHSLTNAAQRTTAMYRVLGGMAGSDPQRAVELLMAEPAQTRDDVAVEVAYLWAAQDSQAAARWACQLDSPEMQKNALRSILRACPTEELTSVGELVLSLPEGPARSALLKQLGERRQESALLDARGALDLAKQIPAGADRNAFLAGVCGKLDWRHVEEAAKLVNAMTASPLQTQAAGSTARSWAEADPAAAGAWAATLPAGDARRRATTTVARQWASRDPDAAGQWLGTLAADGQRAPTVDAYIDATFKVRPDLAAAWVPAITDEPKRAQWLKKVAAQWQQKDPDAARTWLEAYRSQSTTASGRE